MKKTILCAALLLIMCLVCACASSTDETITVGKDTVPTLYSVVGERKITGTEKGFENNVNYVNLSYNNEEVTEDDVLNYMEALRDEGYILVKDVDQTQNPILISLGKESSEDGKIVLVDIAFSLGNNAEIRYAVGAGTISKNDN